MTLEIATHRNILLSILKDIFSDSIMGLALGFTGGTAAYLFYNLPRFSVDLDFDLLDKEHEQYIFENVQSVLEKYGLIKQAREKRFSFFCLLSYENKLHGAYNIKIEINRRDFGSRYEVKSYLGIPMKVMIKEDMIAHKLVAMFERLGTTNRDIFDVWFFLKNNWPINEAIIEKRMDMTFDMFVQKCIAELEAMSDRNILSGLGELPDAQQKVWVKKHLRAETIFLLKMQLQSIQ